MRVPAVRTKTGETVEHGWVVCLSGMRLRRGSARPCPRPPGSVRVLPPAARSSLTCRARRARPGNAVALRGRNGLPWAWVGLGVLLVVVLAAGAIKFLRRQYDSIQDRSINRLLESSQRSRSRRASGRSPVDLDAALELAEKAGPAWMKRLEQERTRRPDLARRDALGVLAGLSRNQSSPFRLGDWLNLIARAKRDPDLAPLATKIDEALSGFAQRADQA